MRLLIGFFLVLVALIYFQNERNGCSFHRMGSEDWLLCMAK